MMNVLRAREYQYVIQTEKYIDSTFKPLFMYMIYGIWLFFSPCQMNPNTEWQQIKLTAQIRNDKAQVNTEQRNSNEYHGWSSKNFVNENKNKVHNIQLHFIYIHLSKAKQRLKRTKEWKIIEETWSMLTLSCCFKWKILSL